MPERLPPRTLMVTFLSNALRERRITVEHLADLLSPTSEGTVQSWIDGLGAPSVHDLHPLAIALGVNPVELTAGWLADHHPELELTMRRGILDPLESSFPRSTDYDLFAPRRRRRRDMSVGDPHDAHTPTVVSFPADGSIVRKRAAGVRKPFETP